jgi:serine/threonine-protein kinase
MGRVYLAEHVRMRRLSAVKVMSPALKPTPDAISRFNREAANASRIHQPNVAAIYDFGETEDGTLYLAMEYVEGETLSALLRREGPLAPQRAADVTGQIAEGLTAAHHLGIVHRDLKPDNVLVTRNLEGREWVKIVDFGIAKATTADTDQNVTSMGMAVGTPEYMSPEQIAGEPLDVRTDLYSLGLVLFNMLTGALPHPALTSKHSLVQRLTARPHTLAEVRPNVSWPPRLQKALDRALALEPDERYNKVADFARDVRGAVGSPLFMGAAVALGALTRAITPVVLDAIPERPPRSGATATRRSRGPTILAAAVLLVGAAVTLAVRPPRALQAFMQGRRLAARPGAAPHQAADSLARLAATNGATSDSATAGTSADSARASGDSLSPIDAGLRLRTAAMRTTGDSLDPAGNPAVMQSAETDAKEIMLHVNRAREFSRTNQLKGAGKELQTAYEEYRIFLTEHAAAPQTEVLRGALQVAMDEAVAACAATRDSLAERGGRPAIRCHYPAKTGILVEEMEETATPRAPGPMLPLL